MDKVGKMMKQTAFVFRTWGGRRKRARRAEGLTRLRHAKRPRLAKRFPVHVTWRVRPEVWQLRTQRCFGALSRAFWQGCNRFGFRLVHYSVQGNHMHLIVEAEGEKSLSKGMNGLGVQSGARAQSRHGAQRRRARRALPRAHLADADGSEERARVSARQREEALRARGEDPYTSKWPLAQPETYLLRRQC